MSGKLKREIKQTRPFHSLQEEVVLSMLRTADQLAAPMTELLRVAKLSLSQYNVLRILRGAGAEGLPCGEISERMVRRDPDLTRLLDRLETRGLVARARGTADRRVVIATITREGLGLLGSLDGKVETAVEKTLSHMPKKRLEALRDLLEEARTSEPTARA
ncbi:MAG: MarR family winged helix-turn-helix transcriptional regulator [Thermoanaerobaculia bacterium]